MFNIDTRAKRHAGSEDPVAFIVPDFLDRLNTQRSVIGSILFLLSVGELPRIIEKHGLCPNLYADDSQIYRLQSVLNAAARLV